MSRDCQKGLQLRLHFEHALREWGRFDAYERALDSCQSIHPRFTPSNWKRSRHNRSCIRRVVLMSSTCQNASSAAGD